MTKDEIIKIAQKVTGVSFPLGIDGISIGMNEKHLQDFANVIAAAEREACAELVSDLGDAEDDGEFFRVLKDAAIAIRAREQV